MKTRSLALSALAALAIAGTAHAGSTLSVGAHYVEPNADGSSVDLVAVEAKYGYHFYIGDSFSIAPEARVLTGVTDADFADATGSGELELDPSYGVSLRFQFDFDNGAYAYLAPAYTRYELSASANVDGYSFSASGGDELFSAMAGFGYDFTPLFSAELSYERTEEYEGAFRTDFLGARAVFNF